MREHRSVCLPDYQGLGIGSRLIDFVSQRYHSLGFRVLSISGHPAVFHSRNKSLNWQVSRKLSLRRTTFAPGLIKNGCSGRPAKRLTASYRFIGGRIEIPKNEIKLLTGKIHEF